MIRSKSVIRGARAGAWTLAAVAAATLAACSQKTDVAPVSEVAARVNGDDITVQQLNIVVRKQRGIRPEQADAASRQILDQLIDEQIIAQKAVAAKLDKDPEVIQQLESARRDILARRFIEAAAETAGKPGADAVQKFYDSRPAMFANRKLFVLQHVEIQGAQDRRAEIVAHVQTLKSAAELTDWLKSQNLKFTVTPQQEFSEQVAPTVLEKLSKMTPGESTVVPTPYGVGALVLVSSQPAPKTIDDARPSIEQYLAAQSHREVIVNLQKTIRDGAKIEYQGKFAASAPAAGTPLPSASASDGGPQAASAPVAAASPVAGASAGIAQPAIQNR